MAINRWMNKEDIMSARQASLSITNSRSLHKPMSIELVMPSCHLIFCRPLLLLPQILPSIRVFSNESIHHMRWPKYWSFSFNISPSSEHSYIKKKERMPFAATQKHLVWRKSDRKRQISCDIAYMWTLKDDTNELIYKTETHFTDIENRLLVAMGEGREGLGVRD